MKLLFKGYIFSSFLLCSFFFTGSLSAFKAEKVGISWKNREGDQDNL